MNIADGKARENHVGASTILFLSPSAYPLGGVADWIEYLLPGLEASGTRCVLGLMTGRHHLVEPYLHRHPWHDVCRISNPSGSREGRINSLMQTIGDLGPDIVMVVNIADAYEAVRRLRIAGANSPRVVMTLHGLQSDLLADISTERDVLDGVIVTNRLTQKLASDVLGSQARVLYASYGVLPQTGMSGSNSLPAKAIRLLYCGRLDQSQKRVFDLPILLKRLLDMGQVATLSIAGGGPDELALRDKFVELQLEDSVKFLGVLDTEALSREYCANDALIISSVWETGPIVAWEAMSHGLPVISSRYLGCGLENALVDGVNCLIFPVGEMDEAARAVARLFSPGLRAQLIAGGLDLIRTRFSRAVSISQWHAAIDRVLELPSLPMPAARPPLPSSGRLDRLFGATAAEGVRRTLGIVFRHGEAGGEWPHTSGASIDEAAWISDAWKVDFMGATH